jgi:large subunit ribosomal protein L25
MATEHKIKATGRNDEGKGASRRLRRAAQIPAIVYGGTAAPQSIQLEHEKTWLASQNEWFYSSILDLDLDGKVQKVLLRDMQRHPYKQIIMHLDFQRVDENQAIRVLVPLHFLNEEKSPAGKSADVVVTHELNEVEVSCLPKYLPEFIEVDLSGLKKNGTVTLKDIKLPKGVKWVSHGKVNPVLASAVSPAAEEVDAPAEGAADAAAAAAPAGKGGKAAPAAKTPAAKTPAKK